MLRGICLVPTLITPPYKFYSHPQLKLQPQLSLKLTLAGFGSNIAKGQISAVDVEVGIGDLRMIEYVDCIDAELEVSLFIDPECLAQSAVDASKSRHLHYVLTKVASSSRQRILQDDFS